MLEVFPVFIGNLHSVAGEWAGFNEESVCEAIIAAKRPSRFRRWMNRRSYWMTEATLTNLVELCEPLGRHLRCCTSCEGK